MQIPPHIQIQMSIRGCWKVWGNLRVCIRAAGQKNQYSIASGKKNGNSSHFVTHSYCALK